MLGFDEGIKMGLSDVKAIGAILGDVYGITIGIDVGTELVSLDGPFDGSNYCKLEGLFIEESLGSTSIKVLVFDEGIKMGLSDVKAIGTILGDVYGIAVGLYVGTDLGSLDGSFDGCNYVKLEG